MSVPKPTPTSVDIDGGSAGLGQRAKNQSIHNFAASLSTAAVVFGVQIVAFLILSGNWKVRKSRKTAEETRQSLFHKIYYYKTSFVSKKKRVSEPVTAIESFKNVFTISDRDLIRIAGVDGYLFLQYLQLLLKIFIPLALLLWPTLLPINRVGDAPNVSGLDSFAWPNAAIPRKAGRLWAHCIMAICVILWSCYNFYLAMRKFVRLRQTILTMPEHRIRASATTILVQTIPRKWLSVAALEALYDVFPGGIRAIWINRDYDALQEKVKKRLKIARALESAETNLVIKCTKMHKKMQEKEAKAAGVKRTKAQKKEDEASENQHIDQTVAGAGITSGNPHQIEEALQEVLVEEPSPASSSSSSSRSSSPDAKRKRFGIPIPVVGEGIQAVGDGFRDVGQGVNKIGARFVGGIRGAFGGKQEHGFTSDQTDGQAERPFGSPVSAEFEPRGPSSDTFAPLNVSSLEKEKAADDGTYTAPTSPETPVKVERASTAAKKDHFEAFKNSAINPLRRMDDFASPQPFHEEGEEFPLESEVKKEPITYNYTGVWNENYTEDDENALWRKYIQPKDRETMRVPIFDKSWWPSLPLIGKKVDTIYYCRKELARLNFEIAEDQAHPENFELMNSAFIQFNHQVAAHMACQALSHHIPRQMAPRTVEVNPNHVMWDNLKTTWWARYLRMFVVIITIVGLVILWGIPVSATGAISQVTKLVQLFHWLGWLLSLPTWLLSAIQGVLPMALVGALLVILPVLLRFLAGQTGTTTTGERELMVQNFYFAFVFVQLFLIVSISSGIAATIRTLIKDPVSIPGTLAQNLPAAANYFFSYMILQAFSISSGTLLQIGAIAVLLIFGFFDTTPRQKVSRMLSRPDINWGTMIPVYTNLAAIGLVYSVIAPLIILMILITLSLFWFTYRYQMIYVSYAKTETNGLIFPKAINQLFTGLYFLQLCLIGLFFLVKGEGGEQACFPQAIIMIITFIFTAIYQILLNRAFGPLFTYLPITFEDEAVKRDEEFQRAQEARWQKEDGERQPFNVEKKEHGENSLLEEEEPRNSRAHEREEDIEMKRMEAGRHHDSLTLHGTNSSHPELRKPNSWASRSRSRSRSKSHQRSSRRHSSRPHGPGIKPLNTLAAALRNGVEEVAKPIRDLESQNLPSSYLFDDIEDTLEDIEPEARQKLVKRAFQHPATRAIQPAVWIPHDQLGVATDEIEKTARFSDRIWITSVDANLDARGNVVYKGLPPDRDPFENIEV
ncbi:DUF221-domain-containing protein [Delitschia confertaspora ATCC 74209]|uniref:DUF221-domain-containing protein n=1 Tax=Delitschia confertaspora ATCC 74209 TaxID=1513339 RepID=A0A9P4JRW5_9PLEO|nr:DUF221-domain-containing protein [Delitschia confertaspora ATCC 74209]